MIAANASEWLYYKVYLGQALSSLDYFIVNTLPQVVNAGSFERWFFLRYTDESGPHLRTRFLAEDRSPQVSATITKLLEKGLKELASAPPSSYRPMIDQAFFSPDALKPRLAVQKAVYEPEFEKFGGSGGIPIAECLFQISSEIALAILSAEADASYSRKTALPCLMDTARRVFVGEANKRDFWKRYSLYWLGGDTPAGADWRQKFTDKSKLLATEGIPVVTPREALPGNLGALTERWEAALEATRQEYSRRPDSPDPAVLGFHFAHLMNNRLGIMPLEESYLAALLEEV